MPNNPHAFVVVYRHDDPRLRLMIGGVSFAGRCRSCGHNCYANPSGIDAMRARDAVPYCATCALEHGEYDSMVQSLTLS